MADNIAFTFKGCLEGAPPEFPTLMVGSDGYNWVVGTWVSTTENLDNIKKAIQLVLRDTIDRWEIKIDPALRRIYVFGCRRLTFVPEPGMVLLSL